MRWHKVLIIVSLGLLVALLSIIFGYALREKELYRAELTQKNSQMVNLVEFFDTWMGIKINIPSGWRINYTGSSFYLKKEDNIAEISLTSLGKSLVKEDSNLDFENYFYKHLNFFGMSEYEKDKVFLEKHNNENNIEYFKKIHPSSQNNNERYYFDKGEVIFTLSFTGEFSSFGISKEIIEKILNSFEYVLCIKCGEAGL